MPKVTEEYLDIRRKQIIDAAYRCFARKGFHQATMRDIYAEAELSPGAIYRYFNSKEEIIEASFVFDLQRSLPLFDRADENPNPIEAIDELLSHFFAGLETAASLGADRVNIQGWGEALVNPRLETPLRDTLTAFRERLAKLIRHAQARGMIQPLIDPEAAGQVIMAAYLGFYLQKAFHPELDGNQYKAVVFALIHGSFAKTS